MGDGFAGEKLPKKKVPRTDKCENINFLSPCLSVLCMRAEKGFLAEMLFG
jgi:hypothetical protein